MNDKYSRQSFLGELSQKQIETVTIGIVGFGGGGSHVGQQLLHIGFKNIKVFDGDFVEESNTHRLVGIKYPQDVIGKIWKADVAKRMARDIQGCINIETYTSAWQLNVEKLLQCQIIIGCVDSFDQRDQLERFCRRHLIAYIDIGMGVKICDDENPQMSGQVILSMPGYSCMRCLGFITEEKLNDDRSRYDDAGPQPQVIWANGVLASSAVGIAVDLVTNWSMRKPGPIYLSYNANTGHVATHPRLLHIPNFQCDHYTEVSHGDPKFIAL